MTAEIDEIHAMFRIKGTSDNFEKVEKIVKKHGFRYVLYWHGNHTVEIPSRHNFKAPGFSSLNELGERIRKLLDELDAIK